MDILIYIICAAMFVLLAIIVLLLFLHHFERKDLYTRIMSKDLADYKKAGDKNKHEYTPSAHHTVLYRWRRKHLSKGGDE